MEIIKIIFAIIGIMIAIYFAMVGFIFGFFWLVS